MSLSSWRHTARQAALEGRFVMVPGPVLRLLIQKLDQGIDLAVDISGELNPGLTEQRIDELLAALPLTSGEVR